MESKCPGCGLVHEWKEGPSIFGTPSIICDNVPPGMAYLVSRDGTHRKLYTIEPSAKEESE